MTPSAVPTSAVAKDSDVQTWTEHRRTLDQLLGDDKTGDPVALSVCLCLSVSVCLSRSLSVSVSVSVSRSPSFSLPPSLPPSPPPLSFSLPQVTGRVWRLVADPRTDSTH